VKVAPVSPLGLVPWQYLEVHLGYGSGMAEGMILLSRACSKPPHYLSKASSFIVHEYCYVVLHLQADEENILLL
jgi:hypothetical protein